MRAQHSIRLSLALWLAPALVLLLIVSAVASYYVARRAVDLAYDHSLESDAADVARFVQFENGSLQFGMSAEAEAILRTDDDDHIYFAIRKPDGTLIGGDADLPTVAEIGVAKDVSEHMNFRDRQVRILAATFTSGAERFVVTIAETTRKRNQITVAIIGAMLSAEGLITALAGITVWVGIFRGLRPLQILEREVSRRTADDLSIIHFSSVPWETQGMVRALNDLLTRLSKAYAEQQRFVADAAHQLRTPLARIQAQVDVLKNLSSEDMPAQVQRLELSVAQTVRLANQLLSLARAEPHAGRPLVRLEADLARVARELMEDWVLTAAARNIDIGFDLLPAVTNCDTFLVREAMSNVVDNALRCTPAGGVVNISTASDVHSARFTVDDSGPGIPAELQQQIFQRFFRLPDSPGEGTGLGLAIVDAIVRAHDADVEVGDSPLGGARVVLQFPFAGQR